MITTLNILYKTNNTYDYLDSQFEDKLHRRCVLIFMVFGLLTGGDFYGRDLIDYRPGESYEILNNLQQNVLFRITSYNVCYTKLLRLSKQI